MPNSSSQVRKQRQKARMHPIPGHRSTISIRLRASPTLLLNPKVGVKLVGEAAAFTCARLPFYISNSMLKLDLPDD